MRRGFLPKYPSKNNGFESNSCTALSGDIVVDVKLYGIKRGPNPPPTPEDVSAPPPDAVFEPRRGAQLGGRFWCIFREQGETEGLSLGNWSGLARLSPEVRLGDQSGETRERHADCQRSRVQPGGGRSGTRRTHRFAARLCRGCCPSGFT